VVRISALNVEGSAVLIPCMDMSKTDQFTTVAFLLEARHLIPVYNRAGRPGVSVMCLCKVGVAYYMFLRQQVNLVSEH